MSDRNLLINKNLVTFAICYQHLSDRINRTLEPLQLNMTQLSILSHFSWQPERSHTISELTKVMEMNQPAVTKAVKSMVNKGWIRREADPDDARVTHLFVNENGLHQLAKARELCFPLISDAFTGFDNAELDQLQVSLAKLKDTLAAQKK